MVVSKKIGHNKVHVLDGGLDAWEKNKFYIRKNYIKNIRIKIL